MQGGRATGVKEREKKKRSERESKKKTTHQFAGGIEVGQEGENHWEWQESF